MKNSANEEASNQGRLQLCVHSVTWHVLAHVLLYRLHCEPADTKTLDRLFDTHPDFYRMELNGDERMIAIADCARAHAGEVRSILDLSVYEGYTLDIVAQRTGAETLSGWRHLSCCVDRAAKRLKGNFFYFDVNELIWKNRMLTSPSRLTSRFGCEMFYYIGIMGHIFWRFPWIFTRRKMQFLEAIRRSATKGVLVQHYSDNVKKSIGAIVERCGGIASTKPGAFTGCLQRPAETSQSTAARKAIETTAQEQRARLPQRGKLLRAGVRWCHCRGSVGYGRGA